MNTQIYRDAVSNTGPKTIQSEDWKDKPHRLVFDLCAEIERLQSLLRINGHPSIICACGHSMDRHAHLVTNCDNCPCELFDAI